MSDDTTPARDEEGRSRSTRWNSGGRSNAQPDRSSRDEGRGQETPDRDRGRTWGSGRDASRGGSPSERSSYGIRGGGFGSRDGQGDRRGSRRDASSRGPGGFDRDERRGFGQRQDERGGYRGARGERGSYGDERRGGFAGRDERRDTRSGSGGRSSYVDRGDDRRSGGSRGFSDRGDDRRDFGRRDGGSRSTDRRDDRGGYSGRRDDGPAYAERRDDRGGYGGRRDDRFQGADRRGGFGGRDRDDARGGSRSGGRFDERGRSNERGRFDDRRQQERGNAGGRGERPAGWSDEQSTIRGPRSWDPKASGDERPRRKPEPVLPEGITGYELDKAVRQQLRTLSKDNAVGVAQHLVAAAELLDEDPQKALDHAQHAVSRAGRVPAAREALGLVLYRTGEYAEALREFRTARRLSGSDHLLPYMVDCERGLGRYERALELANSPEAQRLSEADNIELAIVVSGVRRNMGQARAAVVGLRIPALTKATTQPWAARLFYAYADALLAMDETEQAREWFVKADAADRHGETDASDRIDQIDGFELEDLAPEDEQDVDPRFAELDLSAFGAVPNGQEASSEATDAASGSPSTHEADATVAEGVEKNGAGSASSPSGSDDQKDDSQSGRASRQVPSASSDDGSSRA